MNKNWIIIKTSGLILLIIIVTKLINSQQCDKGALAGFSIATGMLTHMLFEEFQK